MSEITGLLLAAGTSKRFGSHKLLCEIDGQALILRSVATLSPCDRVIALLRNYDPGLHQLLSPLAGIETVINYRAATGMSSSIVTGVMASSESDGWCILPADMPSIQSDTTRMVAQALCRGAPIVVPFYKGQQGHPVGFSNALKSELIQLSGDKGARSILDTHPDLVMRLEVKDPGILRDIDRPQDMA